MKNNNTPLLDDIDQQIIQQLQEDGRKSYRQIAKELELSVGTITNRVNKLKNEGIIKGVQLELDYASLGYNIETIITLQTKNPQTILQKEEYKKHIQTAHNTTGEYNTMLITLFKNPEELNTFLKALNNEKIVEKMNTQLILETINT
jgi:Lrp/AsnC family transcriptional regulator for asnA, asnC and gidA